MNPISNAPIKSTTVKVVRMPTVTQNNAEDAAQRLALRTKEKRKQSEAKVRQFRRKTKTRVQNLIQQTQKQKKARDEKIKSNVNRTLEKTKRRQNKEIKATLSQEQEKKSETIYELDKQIQLIYKSQKEALQRMLDCNPNNNKIVETPQPKLIKQIEKENMAFYASINNNTNNNNNNNINSRTKQNYVNSDQSGIATGNQIDDTNVNNLALIKRDVNVDLVSSSGSSTNSSGSASSVTSEVSPVTESFGSRMMIGNNNNNNNNSENTIDGNPIYCENKHCQSNNKAFWDKGIKNNDDKLTEKERKALFGAIKQWHLAQDRMKTQVKAMSN